MAASRRERCRRSRRPPRRRHRPSRRRLGGGVDSYIAEGSAPSLAVAVAVGEGGESGAVLPAGPGPSRPALREVKSFVGPMMMHCKF